MGRFAGKSFLPFCFSNMASYDHWFYLTLPMPKGRGFLGSHSYRSEIHQAIPVCPTVQLAMPTAEVLLAQY